MDRRTVTKRLETSTPDTEGRYTLRQMYEAAVSYGSGSEKEMLSLQQERAQLAQEQRWKLEREREVAEGELISTHEINAQMEQRIMATRQALLNLPSRMASVIAAESKASTCESLLREIIHEALEELASCG